VRPDRFTWRGLFLLVLCAGISAVVGCSDDEDHNPLSTRPSNMVGTWQLTGVAVSEDGDTEEYDPQDVAEYFPLNIQLNADGSGIADGVNNFTWSATEGSFTVNIPGQGTLTFTYWVSDNTLTTVYVLQLESVTYTFTLTWTKQ
jgi:hypothetical protein